MTARLHIMVTARTLDPGHLIEQIGPSGAVASFIGHVRADDGVTTLTLEHHPQMTERAMIDLARQAEDRWPLEAVTLIHRVGPMTTGDAIVCVIAASPHRAAALEACTYLIDRLKTDVPLWKCETLANGTRRWVEPRAGDTVRTSSWA